MNQEKIINDIICPNCNKVFKVDKAGFADILKQVRDHQFEKEIKERLANAESDKENAIKIAEANLQNKMNKQLAEKDKEMTIALAENKENILNLKSKIDKAETEKKLAISEAIKEVEKQRDSLKNDVNTKELEKQNLQSSLEQKFSSELQNKDAIIKFKDDEIARYRDMKSKLSTKMIGETLEQHCESEFNKLRATGFQNAYFEKDNDASTGSKGDFIYRESDGDGNEIISIMFEMKNEGDKTATKKKNEDFLKELDKDRNEKNCEYAVLVTMLEANSELYNSGIVDVSHRYKNALPPQTGPVLELVL